MYRFSFTYDSVSESEEMMLDDLDRVIEETGISVGIASRFRLAVSEAFTNAFIHGNSLKPGKNIKLTIQVNDSGINADISDEGRGGLERISNRCLPEPLAESGRGIGLIEHCAGSARFWENEQGGLVVSLTFARENKNVANSIE